MPIAGGVYLEGDALNTKKVAPSTWLISSSSVGAGLLTKFLISKRHKIGEKRRLWIISRPGLNAGGNKD